MEHRRLKNSFGGPTHGRVAVIGGGISGLGAAWLLGSRYHVTLYERESYFGGHTNTVTVSDDSGPVAVDTGFIVYNRQNYPQLSALFDHIGVATQATDMSFAASIDGGRVEYAGDSLNALYAQRRHLFSGRFQRMVWDILRFNRAAKRLLRSSDSFDGSVGDFLTREGLGEAFKNHYLLPMAAAIWSCPPRTMLAFPAASLLKFFANHGLLDLKDRPQWRTVVGGGRTYVDRLLERFRPQAHVHTGVDKVVRGGSGVAVVLADGRRELFDRVVIATHADQALSMLGAPDRLERRVLGAFKYQDNRALLHSDPALMPRRRRVWSSWNYLSESNPESEHSVSVTYWMNRLQRLRQQTPYLVSLNPIRDPDPKRTVREISYSHPIFDHAAMAAQRQLQTLQGSGGVWFCGSYFGYGFHEDGLRSAIGVATDFGVTAPWAANAASADRPAAGATA
ncbi:MAG: FAD-dependent oxidoreductase [Gammaproteobacteria bacterium]|nr:FAD-dependent oxidoreductase [Gammaproteobacteria bacterium]